MKYLALRHPWQGSFRHLAAGTLGRGDRPRLTTIVCNEAGLPRRCPTHGLRKATATRLADRGATTRQAQGLDGRQRAKLKAKPWLACSVVWSQALRPARRFHRIQALPNAAVYGRLRLARPRGRPYKRCPERRAAEAAAPLPYWRKCKGMFRRNLWGGRNDRC